MSEFHGAGDLALGSVHGVRSWRVRQVHDSRGHRVVLQGLYGGDWKPGANTARCGARALDDEHNLHRAPEESCQCGFYAYWHLRCSVCDSQIRTMAHPPPPIDRERELAELIDAGRYFPGMVTPAGLEVPTPPGDTAALRVLARGDVLGGHWGGSGTQCNQGGWMHGLIEGYGLTLLGSAGFRCEKARLKALCLPVGVLTGMDSVRDHLARAAALRARYRVPVYTSIANMLDEHPPTRDYRTEYTS